MHDYNFVDKVHDYNFVNKEMIDSVLTQGTVERSIIDSCLLKEFDGVH